MNRQDADTFLPPLLPHALPFSQPHSSDGLSCFKLHSRIDMGRKTSGQEKHSPLPNSQHKDVKQQWEKRQPGNYVCTNRSLFPSSSGTEVSKGGNHANSEALTSTLRKLTNIKPLVQLGAL